MDADQVIIGKMLGPAALGIYSVAMNISSIPLQRAAEVVNSVALPAYSSIQSDTARVANAYLMSLRMASLLSFPVFWGIALIAPDLFSYVLGTKWTDATPIIQIICIAMPIRSLGPLSPPALLAMGKNATSIQLTVIGATIVPISMLIGVQWGLTGTAIAWSIGFPLVFAIGNLPVTRALKIPYFDTLRPIVEPALCGAIMCLTILFMQTYLLHDVNYPLRLCINIAFGGAIYFFALRTLARRQFDEFISTLRSISGISAKD
jgi:O-antigen/teichoic acid export membrane protein